MESNHTEEQFRALYDAHVSSIYRYFLRRVEEESVAQDCTPTPFSSRGAG